MSVVWFAATVRWLASRRGIRTCIGFAWSMVAYCLIPIVLQGVTMVIDEGWFHRERGLSRAERIGHPLDTLTIALCLLWLVTTDPGSSTALPVYAGLAAFSTLFVTKDEAMHAKQYSPGEHRLHALLFTLHPIVLAAFAYLWWSGMVGLLVGQLGITIAFLAYQVIYWSIEGATACGEPESNQDAWYADLGSRWYVAEDTPIALSAAIRIVENERTRRVARKKPIQYADRVANLTRDDIINAWTRLGKLANAEGKSVEIIVVGGAVMAVYFQSRASTADVDAIFEPASETRRWAGVVADDLGLPNDWLNDGVKGYVIVESLGPVLHQSAGITVRTVALAHLLALKLMAWRDDVDFRDALRILQALAADPGTDCSSCEKILELVDPYFVPSQRMHEGVVCS